MNYKKIKILLNKNNLEKKIELVNNNLIKGYLKKNVKHQGIIVEAKNLIFPIFLKFLIIKIKVYISTV